MLKFGIFGGLLIYNPAIGFFYVVEGDFEDVGKNCEDLWLAVKVRFEAIDMVERARLIFNYVYFL